MKTIIKGYAAISTHCRLLGVPEIATDTAKAYFHDVVTSGGYRNLTIRAIAAVCIKYACEVNDVPRKEHEVRAGISITQEEWCRARWELDRFFLPKDWQSLKAYTAKHPRNG